MSNALMDITNASSAALLPSSVAGDAEMLAICKAVDYWLQYLGSVVPTLGILATLDDQPEIVLDELAPQFHIDYWDFTWPLDKKRWMVKNAIRLHRIAGTRGAVNDVVSNIWGDTASIREWWEYGGEPGTFQVTLTDEQTAKNVNLFVESIRSVKRATDHLTIVIATAYSAGNNYAGAVYHQFRSTRIEV